MMRRELTVWKHGCWHYRYCLPSWTYSYWATEHSYCECLKLTTAATIDRDITPNCSIKERWRSTRRRWIYLAHFVTCKRWCLCSWWSMGLWFLTCNIWNALADPLPRKSSTTCICYALLYTYCTCTCTLLVLGVYQIVCMRLTRNKELKSDGLVVWMSCTTSGLFVIV